MTKKGFTLVELLAVIVILAIILAIAIPSITSVIENSQVNAFKSNERMLLKAARTYVGTNDSALPTNIGDTREITLNTLQTNGFLNPIKDPIDRTTSCSGYVIITKTDTSEYDYTPYLNCENNVGDSTTDGLIANYQFDDYKESTVNYLASGLSGYTVFNPGCWNGATLKTVANSDLGTPIMQYDTAGTSYAYSDDYVLDDDLTTLSGKTVTFSIYVRRLGAAASGQLRVYDDISGYSYFPISVTTEFQRFEVTKTLGPSPTRIFVMIDSTGGGTYQFHSPQLEAKSYATAFINGTRNTIIRDYSGDGNNATLLNVNIPTWNSNGRLGQGAYSFDGVDDYAELPDSVALRMSTGGTITAWIYPKTLGESTYGRIIDKSTGLSSDNGYCLLMSPNNAVYFSTNAGTQVTTLSTNNAFTLNAWNHVVVTFNASGRKVYVNGKDVTGSGGSSTALPPNVAGVVGIGNRASNTDRTFDGSIDDLRLYNRVLSADEVKQLYNSTK